MLKKRNPEVLMDREVLLDLDYGGETHGPDSYGSVQNGGFIPPRYLMELATNYMNFSPDFSFANSQRNSSPKNEKILKSVMTYGAF